MIYGWQSASCRGIPDSRSVILTLALGIGATSTAMSNMLDDLRSASSDFCWSRREEALTFGGLWLATSSRRLLQSKSSIQI
jgi:hypothetical protein